MTSKPKMILTHPNWWSNQNQTLFYWNSVCLNEPPPGILLSPDYGAAEIAKLSGQWSVIDLRAQNGSATEEVRIIQDISRSRPLFYNKHEEQLLISDRIESFEPQNWILNSAQWEIFPHFGYTLGNETLIDGVSSAPAASITTISPTATFTKWLDYRFSAERTDSKQEFATYFLEALESSFSKMLDRASGRQIVVPTSGGLDSHLMLSMLHRLGVTEVLCYSYGRSDGEAVQAAALSESLGFEYVFLESKPTQIRQNWSSSAGADFRSYTWNGTSLPHVQDWDALRQLEELGLISEKSLFLPGHTIVGNMHNNELASTIATKDQIRQAILKQHGNLQGKAQKLNKNQKVRDAIHAALKQQTNSFNAAETQASIEWFNITERQAKYINNSMRNYEFFGADWALPMLDTEVVNEWLRGAGELTLTRSWYSKFVQDIYAQEADTPLRRYDPRSQMTVKYIDSKAARFIAKSWLAPALNRLRIAMTGSKHPLAFESFDIPNSRPKQFINRLRGKDRMGEWAQAFLNNRWGSNEKIVPERPER